MRHNCNFHMNPAFVIGLVLMWAGVIAINVLELDGGLTHLLCGMSVGMVFVGLLYGSPKTRPLFDRFHAFKLRFVGR